MKRIAEAVILGLALITLCVGINSVEAQAKRKNTQPVTAEQQLVNDLTTYLNVLVTTGASSEDIIKAQEALKVAQAALDEANARAMAEATIRKQQAEYEKALKKLLGQKNHDPNVYPLIFIGDSRTVQMHEAVGDTGAWFVGENGKGYKWFVEKAIPKVDAHVGKGTRILINLGVNDPGNADKYVAEVNRKTLEWTAKGANVYYATVYPVTENPYTTDEAVQVMNQKLVLGLQNVAIIDTYTWLKATGYKMVDGLHFTDSTYINIYHYLFQSVMR